MIKMPDITYECGKTNWLTKCKKDLKTGCSGCEDLMQVIIRPK